jgi:MFS family permease
MLSKRPARPPVFHGWWVLLVAVFAMFTATLTGGAGLSVFVLPITTDLGWSRATIAWALGLGTLLGALSAPLFGWLIDRFGARVMLTATGVGLALTLLPLAWVQEPVFFYLGYSSARMIDMGMLNTAAMTAVANWFIRLRGRTLGLAVAGNAIGVAVITPLAQWIIEGWGWRVAWFSISLVMVALLTPLAWVLVRRRPEDLGLYPDGDPEPRRVTSTESWPALEPLGWSLRSALRTPTYWLLVVSTMLPSFAVTGLSIHQIPLLIGNGIAPLGAALVVSLFGLTWVAACIGWGLIAERVPPRFALAGNYLLTGTCMLSLVWIHDLRLALVYGALYGMCNGGMSTLDALVWANYYGRRAVGAIRGSSRPFIVGAGAFGGGTAGWFYDTTGSYVLIVSIFGLLSLTGGLLVLLARPPRTSVGAKGSGATAL